MQKTIGQNASYFTIAMTIQKVLSFFYFWYISNQLLADSLGKYVFALSVTGLFSFIIDLGILPVLIRETAKNLNNANLYLKNLISLKLVLAIIAVAVIFIFINITNKPTEIKTLVYLATVIIFLDAFSHTFWAIFRAYKNLFYESIGVILVQAIILSLGIYFLKISGSLSLLMTALVAASVFNFLFSAFLVGFKLKFSIIPSWNNKIIKTFLKLIPAFALAAIFTKIYNYTDSVLLGFLASDEAVGYYAICAKTIYSLQQIIPAAFAAAIFPVFASCYKTSKDQLNSTFQRAFSYIVVISLPMTAGLLLLLPKIVKIVWPEYIEVLPTFMIMATSIPFLFMAFPTGYLLNACDRQKNTTINRGAMTALAIILNIILIPQYSYLGAGITFLVASIIVFILDWIWIQKIVKIKTEKYLPIIGKSLLASLAMSIFIYFTKNYLCLLFILPLAVVTYFSVLIFLKGITFAETKQIFKSTR